jgi:hypothetical protein
MGKQDDGTPAGDDLMDNGLFGTGTFIPVPAAIVTDLLKNLLNIRNRPGVILRYFPRSHSILQHGISFSALYAYYASGIIKQTSSPR